MPDGVSAPGRTRRPARLVVAIVAVVVLAWLAAMARDTWHYDRGVAAAARLDDPARAARAERELHAASRLNPDRTPDIRRALILWLGGHTPAARALLEDAVAAEPDNLSAWTALDWVAGSRDPRRAREALAEMRRLDPVNGAHPPVPPPRP
jgi:hypothetical protein